MCIGAADCNHYNCYHNLSSGSSKVQFNLVHILKRFVVTVAVVTVCCSYETYMLWLARREVESALCIAEVIDFEQSSFIV